MTVIEDQCALQVEDMTEVLFEFVLTRKLGLQLRDACSKKEIKSNLRERRKKELVGERTLTDSLLNLS